MNKNRDFFNLKASTWDEHHNQDSNFFDDFVEHKCFLKEGDVVLDLACGTGIITNSIYKITKAKVIGLDVSDKMIEIAESKNKNTELTFINDDFYDFKNYKFDAIICHNAYPHFLDKEKFKLKSCELLNTNGKLIICHTFSREKVNALHKRPGMIESKITLPAKEESNFYKDKFEEIFIEDDEFYVIVLSKK